MDHPRIFIALPDLAEISGIPLGFGVELRLDLMEDLDFHKIASYIKTSPCPVMLTLRSTSHGGKFPEKDRTTYIEKICELNTPFVDLEWDLPFLFLEEIIHRHPEKQFILSYHNIENAPFDLDAIFQKMKKIPAHHYKIAATVHSFDDAIRMLQYATSHPKLSTICMGEKGSFTRIFSGCLKNKIQFGAFKQATAPGQIPYQDLDGLYRFLQLSSKTALYGLIGDPVIHSQGHVYHNRLFAQKHMDAVYIKIPVKEEELASFFAFAKKAPFKGLSVTMPLKEKVIPFLDEIDSDCQITGAVNTIVFQKDKLIGKNTDGKGALDAIGNVKDKTIVILGAGGSAKAIAFEAIKRGAIVFLLNRNETKAKEIALSLHCQAGSLSDVPKKYDILINATSHPLPIDPSKILAGSIVMDITYVPKETEFLKEAMQRNCQIIYGEQMFFNQADHQRTLWGV